MDALADVLAARRGTSRLTTTSPGSASTSRSPPSFAATALGGVPRLPVARARSRPSTGTMLVCDAWFDVVTSQSGGEMWRGRRSRRRSPSCRSRRSARSSSTTPRRSSRRPRRASALTSGRRQVGAALEQPQPVLELRDAELELVELVAGHEVRARRRARAAPPSACSENLARLPRTPRGQLGEELLERVDEPARYRARPCGLVRRRCRRFSRRACAPRLGRRRLRSTSTSSGVGSAASACLRLLRARAVPASTLAAAAARPSTAGVAVRRRPASALPLRVLRLALLPDREQRRGDEDRGVGTRDDADDQREREVLQRRAAEDLERR